MASSSLCLYLSTSLFLTLLYSSQANDLIAKICSQAENPSLCNQVFSSDPRACGADLGGLGQIILEKSAAAIRDVVTAVKSLGGGGGRPGEVCIESCGRSIDDLKTCSDLLKSCGGVTSSCKADLRDRGSGAFTQVDDCQDEFGGSPGKLKEAIKRSEDLIDVFVVIANSF